MTTAMTEARPFAEPLERLKQAGLRPTRQRLALARLLFSRGDRHVSAEQLHAEAKSARVVVSLATVYNALNQFRDAGLLREVVSMAPMDRLLLETDAPYLAPVPYRGKTNEPSYLPNIAARVAEIKELDISEVVDNTTTNALRLFSRIIGN